MITRVSLAKTTAIVVAVGLHMAAAVSFVKPSPVIMEGAVGTNDVRLGTSFQDMVEGGISAAQTTEPEQITEALSPPSQVTHRSANQTETAVEPITAEALAAKVPAAETLAVVPVTKVTRAVAQPPLTPKLPQTQQTARPPATEVVLALEDQSDDSPKVTQSPIPQARPKQPTPPRPVTAAAAGNATQSAVAGSSQGSVQGTSVAQGQAGQLTEQGSAAVDNYPGKVARCIAKGANLRTRERGTATVSFQIDQSGNIVRVSLRQSSGNVRLDAAAVAAIQERGPCPKPPNGAQTQFHTKVKGR